MIRIDSPSVKVAIIPLPEYQYECDILLAVERANMEPVEFLWNEPAEKLSQFDGYIILGSSSSEDESRAKAIAARDPIMEIIKKQSELGKPILGIGSGAHILVESGLVPGVENNKLSLALTYNQRADSYDGWTHLRPADPYQYNAFTRRISPDTSLHLPVAHSEGRFVIPPALLIEMRENGLAIFQYSDERGSSIGSVENIAAISNKAGNVMAIVAHPERDPSGDVLFQSMREYITEGYRQKIHPLNYYPRVSEVKPVKLEGQELLIGRINGEHDADNETVSMENALRRLDLPVKINRYVHWEVVCNSPEIFEKIKSSGVLFDDQKEKIIKKSEQSVYVLVRAKEDRIGWQKRQILKDHLNIDEINAIRHGILWQIDAPKEIVDQVLETYILFNPYSHNGFYC